GAAHRGDARGVRFPGGAGGAAGRGDIASLAGGAGPRSRARRRRAHARRACVAPQKETAGAGHRDGVGHRLSAGGGAARMKLRARLLVASLGVTVPLAAVLVWYDAATQQAAAERMLESFTSSRMAAERRECEARPESFGGVLGGRPPPGEGRPPP